MCFPPAARPCGARSLGEIGAQSRLVDLPVAVLASVEQNDGQTVTEFGSQIGIRCSSVVDVDAGDLDPELLPQRFELSPGRFARPAPGSYQKGEPVRAPGSVGSGGKSFVHAFIVRHGEARGTSHPPKVYSAHLERTPVGR